MDYEKVHLIVGDDIYYEDHEFDTLPYFRNKEVTDAYRYCYE